MENLIDVRIETKDGVNYVSSRVIAEQLGKRHSDVIPQIEKILTNENVRPLILIGEYKDKKGEIRKEYLLTKDGFILYMFNIQGYNDFKMAYINRFNEMEKALTISTKDRLLLQLFSSDPVQVANAHKALVEIEKKPLVEKIKQDKPLVDFASHVSESVNSIDVGTFAKILFDENIRIGRNRLFNWFKDNKYLMKDTKPYQQYVDLGYFDVIEQTFKTPYGEKRVGTKTLLTGKGQIYFTEKLRKEFTV